MQDHLQNIERFLAAHEAGAGKYPDDVMNWLASRFRDFKRCPAMGLDEVFSIKTANLKERRALYKKYVRDHFVNFEDPLGRTKHCAAEHMAQSLHLLEDNYQDQNVEPQYRLLFDTIRRLGFRLPGDEAIRKILGKV